MSQRTSLCCPVAEPSFVLPAAQPQPQPHIGE